MANPLVPEDPAPRTPEPAVEVPPEAKPVEPQPLGAPEETIIKRIVQGGEEDKVFADIAGVGGTENPSNKKETTEFTGEGGGIKPEDLGISINETQEPPKIPKETLSVKSIKRLMETKGPFQDRDAATSQLATTLINGDEQDQQLILGVIKEELKDFFREFWTSENRNALERQSEDEARQVREFILESHSKDSAWQVIDKVIRSKFGDLNPDWCKQFWFISEMRQQRAEAYVYNLQTMLNIEKSRPGICQALAVNFGIADFARYPEEILVKQFDDLDQADKPYGVVMFARADSNGVFYLKNDILTKLNQDISPTHNLKVVEIGNKKELVHMLNQLRKKYGKAAFAIIGGHGNPSGIQLGSGEWDHISIEDVMMKGTDAISLAFEADPTIILFSCSTGQREGIGQKISGIGATVIAPEVDTTAQEIKVSRRKGKLEFKVKYNNKKSSAQYYMGNPT